MGSEPAKGGRPRSEEARTAVLHAVDDLLVEMGYAALTMKAIAERAGVSRMTVYRWWSTKAEILLEATTYDARKELRTPASVDPLADVTSYVDALIGFLSRSDAGAAYRALVGEAQHDPAVAQLVAGSDVLVESARDVVRRALGPEATAELVEQSAARLVGPPFFWVMTGRDAQALDARGIAEAFLREAGVSRR